MNMEETTFELRTLGAEDIFPMVTILKKIGFKEFKDCLNPEKVQALVADYKADEASNTGNMAISIGMDLVFDVAGVIIENLGSAEKEIFTFCASVAQISVEDCRKLSLADFARLILAIFTKDDFKDFFKVVSELFK